MKIILLLPLLIILCIIFVIYMMTLNMLSRSGKTCWESQFVRLEKEEILVFDQEPSVGGQPRSKTHLSQPNCCISVMAAVPKSELPNTSNVDLPYVFKVCE